MEIFSKAITSGYTRFFGGRFSFFLTHGMHSVSSFVLLFYEYFFFPKPFSQQKDTFIPFLTVQTVSSLNPFLIFFFCFLW